MNLLKKQFCNKFEMRITEQSNKLIRFSKLSKVRNMKILNNVVGFNDLTINYSL